MTSSSALRIWFGLCLIGAMSAAFSAPSFAGEPAANTFKSAADYESLVGPTDRQHWAFQPLGQSPPPAVRQKEWVRNPIDQFILAKLEAKGWRPSPSARPVELLRRMHLDLVGLPPTLAEQDAFLRDPTPAAADRRMDELLAHPGYGERWGRHWLDLVRYADTNGYERDGLKPHVWRYRDYVIRSLNADKPCDRFLREQLAGDELPDSDADALIALGYYRLGPWDDEPVDERESRSDQLDDIVSTTAQAFLGLSLGCARCHNHKFEALTQLDYYRMTAIFNTLQRFRDNRQDLDAPVGRPSELAAERLRDKMLANWQQQIEALRRDVQQELFTSGRSKLPAAAVAAFLREPRQRTGDQRQLVNQYRETVEQEVTAALPPAVREKIHSFERQKIDLRKRQPDLPRGYFMHEPAAQAPPTSLLSRGRFDRPAFEVEPGVPLVLQLSGQRLAFPPPGERTTLRRLTLANWIASPQNPLTARVLVNRVWLWHFGEGLVRTPHDFGVMGQPPSHPELLDWLAVRFMSDGWSLKKLHRLIMTSNTYRMSKRSIPEYAAQDPENQLFWRVPYRRLEVEPLRDSVLFVSGRLDRRMFGPSVYLYIPPEALAGSADRDLAWKPFNEQTASRRTIYACIKRSLVVPLLEVLDLCDSTRTAPQRSVTCIAPQALTLFNGQFVNEQAAHFAQRLQQEAGPEPLHQIRLAFRLALSREPTPTEAAHLLAFLRDAAGQPAAPRAPPAKTSPAGHAQEQALVQLCRAIFNLNEFAYPD